ncbi:GAP1-N1 domain-containing protein [Gluconacetobacter dulcium]|uniref:GAP1-N1 domain-containing protein n=1 Tax=Gluconacetobacter dulcium TaxID=2729096 RepID=UPI0035C8299C
MSRYALMRTWPAPEMSRPGCVWTHALLLEPSLFEEMCDLSMLRLLMARPQGDGDRERYRRGLVVPISTCDVSSRRTSTAIDLVPALLSALYGVANGIVSVDEPGDLDDSLFAVWSQQWPRLRRNLRFQTAAARDLQLSGGARFDVSVMLRNSSSHSTISSTPEGSWLPAAASDVERPDGNLRRFLWRYGADVRRQRGSFRPLVEVKLLHDVSEPDAGSRVLGIVTESFPNL